MNYLAHLHLGGQRPAQLLGSLYGDFVKGPLPGRFPAELEASIRLHRSIDSFTDNHPLIKDAMARFPAQRRRYAGIMLDVFFDHCLARDWHRYADIPLESFTRKVYGALAAERQLPERLALIAPRMAAQDWLGSYREFDVLEQVLGGISRRLSRPEGLAGAMQELQALYQPLSADFAEFYPLLQDFAQAALAGRDTTSLG
ncbi:acyl carrier protein phosphodiesterase [Pseudomonas capsici]|uniref:ACP phosphodiesterase n=1 Tax=Pseudomonas capsici TaxID=2810614 RepID=A0ABT3BTE2_9PSED|nr:ACP phosphodiesterase [Pseudomonas capsici]MBX8473209.1 ACP phosphodiesterase [Pseudomonas cichorii]MBX8606817.1 ACP phosphodiesterase [Pseudomonas cichorii]MCV4263208.1 ACP phosphodiesterase [Pseudomonas capsici]MCV4266782.1 ACP phosphodiesterase [Pseudomonas capsici]MCV4272016.1 ACP phosphodiesterase [Pseudomonas capsici]